MKNKRLIVLVLAYMLLSFGLIAQTDDEKDLGNEKISVIQDYAPIVADAVKINYSPTLPEFTTDKKTLTYTQPVKIVPVTYQSISIKPLGIAKEKAKNYPSSYIKVGFGTQYSPFAEVLYNEGKMGRNKGRFEKMNYGFRYKHLSAYGSKLDHQDFSDNEASVFSNFFFKKSRFNAALNYDQHARFYYGYDNTDTTFSRKEAKLNYQNYGFTGTLLNTKIGKSDFSYKANIDGYYYKDRFGKTEYDGNISLDLQKIVKHFHYINLDIYEDYSVFNKPGNKLNRNIFSIKPRYMFNDQIWRVFISGFFVWEGNVFHLLPDVGMERSLWKEYIIVLSGWKIELDKNSFKSFSQANPYIDNFELFNSRTETRYLSIKGTVAKNLTYNAKLSQKVVRRLPVFVNNTVDSRKFDLIYDSQPIMLNVQLELDYRAAANLNFHLTGVFNNYEMDNLPTAWHMPRFKVNLSTQYNIGDKLAFTFDLLARDGVNALLPDGNSTKLKGTVDLNLGANYKFSKYLSFFCNLRNLANVKYQQYYLYPSYGFNGMVGAVLTY